MSSKRSAFEDAPELTAAEKKGGFADDDAVADEKHTSAKAEEKKSRRSGGSRLSGDVGQFRRVNRQGTDQAEETTPEVSVPSGTSNRKHFEDTADIMVIPDLEEDNEEEMRVTVAEAPRQITRRLPTLRELEQDLSTGWRVEQPGLDIGILTSVLVAPDKLAEDDQEWTFESLMQDITQALSDVHLPK